MNSSVYVATNNDGYTFLGWFKNNKLISTDLELTDSDLEGYEARWINYKLTILFNEIEGTATEYDNTNVTSGKIIN